MRYLSFLLLALPLVAVASPTSPVLEARTLGHPCNKSSQCGSVNNFCNRSKCSVRKPIGSSCYKSIGCISNSCKDKKCVPAGVLKIDEKCETSSSCESAYCGRSKCAAKQADGSACYKAAGCTSGICTDKKCVAKSVAPTPDPKPEPEPTPTPTPKPTEPTAPVDFKNNVSNNGHFESGTLEPEWESSQKVNLSSEDATAKDGTHYVIFDVPAGTPGTLSQDLPAPNPPPRRRDELERRAVVESYDASLWYRVPKFEQGSVRSQCNLFFGINREASNAVPTDYAIQPITAVTSEWAEYKVLLESEPHIADYQVHVRCDGLASTTVHVDWVSFVPNIQKGRGDMGMNINNKGNVVIDGGFNLQASEWTLIDGEYSDATPAYLDDEQRDNGHVILTGFPDNQRFSIVKQRINLHTEEGDSNLKLSGSFRWRTTDFSNSDPAQKCRIYQSVKGPSGQDIDLQVIEVDDEDNAAPNDGFKEAATTALTDYVAENDASARVWVNCDGGASMTVAIDAIKFFVDGGS